MELMNVIGAIISFVLLVYVLKWVVKTFEKPSAKRKEDMEHLNGTIKEMQDDLEKIKKPKTQKRPKDF